MSAVESAQQLGDVSRAWVSYVGVGCEAIALASSFRVRRPMHPALRLLAVFLAVSILEDILGLWWAAYHGNNLWMEYFESPINALLIIWSFIFWQTSDTVRLALRITGILYCLVCLALVLTVERTDQFGTYSYPIQALLILGIAAYTLVARARATDEPLVRQDWFWICVGWAVAETFTLALYPLVNSLLAANEMTTLWLVVNVRIGAYSLGVLLMALGFHLAATSQLTEIAP